MAQAQKKDTDDQATEEQLAPTPIPAGARKAAVALLMLGNELAGEILSEMSEAEVQLLLRTAKELGTVDGQEATGILQEYTDFFHGQSLLVPRAEDFVRTAAEGALGADRIRSLLGLEEEEVVDDSLSTAVTAGSEAIAMVLKKEHPQTMAVALAVMPTQKAAEVLSHMPEDQRPEIVRRVAQMRSVTPELLKEIGDTLNRELDASVGSAMSLDGQNLVVALLKSLSSEQEEAIFEGLNESDPQLSEEIRKKMFVFEDLLTLDPRALQSMLKEIDGRTLTLSLKTATTALREHILSCMSSRAATMILEDLEAMGPVSVSQVEMSQDEIVQVALRLASEGKITLR